MISIADARLTAFGDERPRHAHTPCPPAHGGGVLLDGTGHHDSVSGRDLDWEDLLSVMPLPVSVIDEHGRQVFANRAYADFLGYDPDELADLDVGRITRHEDAQWTRTYLRRLIGGELDDFRSDKWYVRKDGSEVLGRLSCRTVRDDTGRCTAIVATIEPVESIEPRAEPFDTQLARLLEFSGDHLSIVDVEGTVIESTGRHTEILGYPTAYWAGRQISELVAPEDWDRLEQVRDAVLSPEGERDVTTEMEVYAADGSLQTLVVRIVNCLDDPAIRGIVLVTRNITDHRTTVAELAQRSVDAESVVDAQTRLLATVSHELRNPLHAVRGLAELLASEELGERAGELATALVRQLSGLAQVTQDLLDAARFDAGKVSIEVTPTDLNGLVDDVVGLGRAAAGERELDVSSRVAHDVPGWVLADGNRLRQVLGNLVGNAVKFTSEGSVHVVVRPGQDGALVFSVIDTGVGIPPEEQSKILEPFTVASNSGDQRGAGLGLSIVHRLVTAMGGRVTLTSKPGEGTRFDIVLPLVATDAPSSAVDDALPAGLTVLVIEDNPVNQQLATSQLERLGLVPVIAGTGEDGYDQLVHGDAGRFDVILMDHQLPGMTGIETTQKIRELAGDAAEIPVIGLSASASAADRDAFVQAGMDDFLAKPASLDDLSRAIGRAIRGESDRTRHDHAEVPTTNQEADMTETGPAIDDRVLAQLADDFGDASLVVELVNTFLGELDARIGGIVDAADDQAAGRAAHALKSSARLLGANDLADACQQIEHDGVGDIDVISLAGSARRELEVWRSSQPA